MVMYCVVPHCKNSGFQKGISFHTFPKDPTLRRLWEIKIRRHPNCRSLSSYMRICSEHFKASDYMVSSKKIKFLKKDAVPSIFSFNSEQKNTKSQSCSSSVSLPNLTECVKSSNALLESRPIIESLKNSDLCLQNSHTTTQSNPTIVSFKKSTELIKNASSMSQSFSINKSIQNSTLCLENSDAISGIPLTIESLQNSNICHSIDKSSQRTAVEFTNKLPTLFLVTVAPEKSDIEITDSGNILNRSDLIVEENQSEGQESGNEGLEDENEGQANPSVKEKSIRKEVSSFKDLLDNILLIRKPNSWWNIASFDYYIVCARWNEEFLPGKRVVVTSKFDILVFLEEKKIDVSDWAVITSVDDFSDFLEKIESI